MRILFALTLTPVSSEVATTRVVRTFTAGVVKDSQITPNRALTTSVLACYTVRPPDHLENWSVSSSEVVAYLGYAPTVSRFCRAARPVHLTTPVVETSEFGRRRGRKPT